METQTVARIAKIANPDKIPRMVSPHDLQRLDAILLAVMCKKLAQDETADPALRAKAQAFKDEWHKLVDNEPAPQGNGKQFDAIKDQVAELKSRMVVFLAPLI